MAPDRYGTFLLFAVLLVLTPGSDFAVVVKNVLTAGRRGGLLASLGVVTSNLVHGTFAVFGLGAMILRSQVLFDSVRWVGVVYLVYLGSQALRSAGHGAYEQLHEPSVAQEHSALHGWRQGFLSNITNPKVLAFYVSVLPQFLTANGPWADGLVLAYTHALLSVSWLVLVVVALNRVSSWLRRHVVRRILDAATGTALVGLGAVLASERR